MRPLSKAYLLQGWRGPNVGPADSRGSSQLIEVQQNVVGRSSCLPISVVADDDDSYHPVDDGRTHPFRTLQTLQPWNRYTARRTTLSAIPEPEGEVTRLSRDRPTDDQVLAYRGDVGQPTNSVAAQIQFIEIGRQPRDLFRLEDARRILDARNDRAAVVQRAAEADQQSLLGRTDFPRFTIEPATGFDIPHHG